MSVDQAEKEPGQQGGRVYTSPVEGGVEEEGVTKPQVLLLQGQVQLVPSG